jgi:hypothetical protein
MSEMKDFNLPTQREMPTEKWLVNTNGSDTITDLVRICLMNTVSFRVAVRENDYDFFVIDSMEKYEIVFDALQDILEN